jgi:hypothetical protein
MVRLTRKPAALYAGLSLLYAIAAMLVLRAFSRRHSELEYLVAGTLITTIALGAAFFALVSRRKL